MASFQTVLMVACLTCPLWGVSRSETMTSILSSSPGTNDATLMFSTDTTAVTGLATSSGTTTSAVLPSMNTSMTTLASDSTGSAALPITNFLIPTSNVNNSSTSDSGSNETLGNGSLPVTEGSTTLTMPAESTDYATTASHQSTVTNTTELMPTAVQNTSDVTANPNVTAAMTTLQPNDTANDTTTGNITGTTPVPTIFSNTSTAAPGNKTNATSATLTPPPSISYHHTTKIATASPSISMTTGTAGGVSTVNGKDLGPVEGRVSGGVVIGALLGCILGIILLSLLVYFFCARRKSDHFNHRRLYDNISSDPVLRLNTENAVDLRYQDDAAYYNPAALNDALPYTTEQIGDPNYEIQMSDLPPSYANIA
ncbi:mucin-15 [Scyliorhinus canicula]|uniref:mucin-15 n=1 Tax=Scyliorhinus canicula TaxID=7830 RepID=UPI0018F73968|nr:mucin-15 [Scyliorhinus canicula]